MASRLSRLGALISRRSLLWRCLAILGVEWPFSLALQSPQPGFRKLKYPVVIPQERVAEVWTPVDFEAVCSVPASAETPGGDVVLKGILLRVPHPESETDQVRAFCLDCPHEFCYLYFTKNSQSFELADGRKPDHPVLVCPCHFSIFDPVRDGIRLTGPATRGLYRFRLESRQGRIEIDGVEEGAV